MTPAEFKAARTRLGLSTNQMAKLLEVSPLHVRRLEIESSSSAHRAVTASTARLLQALLDGYRPRDWRSIVEEAR